VSPHVAVAHYPEGAGHATRMMAVARGLQRRDATVSLAGGGPGGTFYETNGFDAFEPTRVDYVRDFQDAPGPVRGLGRVLTASLPDSVRRLRDVAGWLRAEEPDAVVTDDMFAAGAATWTGTPLYVLTHNAANFYRSTVVRVASRGLNLGQRLAARRFFYPTVWPPHADDPPQVSRVPPVALDPPAGTADAGPAEPGVVVVPSTYSEGFDGLAADIAAAGHTVTHVGGPDWEPVPALLPVIERAEAVVCAGYSTVMEAAVAGTPCVVVPHTNEQRGVGRRLDSVEGFAVATHPGAALTALEDPPSARPHTNGVGVIAERILDDLQ
jgi:hypothetical protein